MDIETVCLPQIIEAVHLSDLDYFVRHTAFIVSHKSESLDTLRTVLRYVPAESPLIIVSNCPPRERAHLRGALDSELAGRPAAYLAHQKDERIAHFFRECGVSHILGADGAVVDGKGEGMYIGALLATLLRRAEWLIYFDADNHAPSALLEYTLAMGRLFMAAHTASVENVPIGHSDQGHTAPPELHNVRVCWASKPTHDGGVYTPGARVVGRCTQMVAPFCDELVRARQPWTNQPLTTPNAGEQGMTMRTAMALRFSSGFSVETFQLLDLFFQGARQSTATHGAPRDVLLQQYQSGSPHFHEKKDDGHIRGMIAQSLGSFLHFKRALPVGMMDRIASAHSQLDVSAIRPAVYPALRDLPLAGHESLVEQFRLGTSARAVSA